MGMLFSGYLSRKNEVWVVDVDESRVEKINRDGVDFSMPLLLGYTGLSDDMLRQYIRDSQALWKDHVDTLDCVQLCSVIGTHAGPGAVAVAYFKSGEVK